MKNDLNPYAPPQSRVGEVASSQQCRWEGKNVLYVPLGSELPSRCVKCNAPAATPTKARRLYWHHGAYYLFILFNLIIYAIIASFVRKKFVVSPGLCRKHASARMKRRLIVWSLFGFGLFAIWTAFQMENGAVAAMLGIAAILGAVVIEVAFNRIVYAIEISDRYARLKGCGEPFLASIGR